MAKLQWAVIPELCEHGIVIGRHVMPIEMLFDDAHKAAAHARALDDPESFALIELDEEDVVVGIQCGHQASAKCQCDPAILRANELPIYVHRMVQ